MNNSIKGRLALALFVALFVICASASGIAATVDLSTLLVNPGFEAGTMPNTLGACPPGWTCFAANGPAYYNVTPAQYTAGSDGLPGSLIVPEGARAAACPYPEEGSCVFGQFGDHLGTYAANTTYTITLWIGSPRTLPKDNMTPTAPVDTIRFQWGSSPNSAVAFTNYSATDITSPPTGQWKSVTLTFTPNAGQIGTPIAAEVFVNGGGNNLVADFDITPSAAIGDFVWNDTNKNGIQETGESGINGVTVQLYLNSVSPANLVATTTTGPAPAGYAFPLAPPNTDGFYQFAGLAPGNYIVAIPTQASLTNFMLTPATQGGNPALDSNGLPGTPGFTATAAVTVATATSVDETIDFGYFANPPVVVTCAAATTGTVGVSYSSSIVATGGVPGYTFTISAGSLPPGLTLNTTNGAITGIPTTPGPFSFTVKAVDSTGTAAGTATTNCTITIDPSPIALTCPAATGQVGVAYSSALVATGGVPGYTYSISAGTLPPGLTLNPTTGAITGTPTTPGPFSFTGKVVDSTGTAAGTTTTNCTITIAPGPDLTAVKTNNVGGSTTLPNGWTWNILVSNIGTGAASFTAGQTVLTDNLPTPNLTFGAASLGATSGITGTVSCTIVSTTLTCTATTAVTIGAAGFFNVSFLTTPSATGTYVNPPAGQVCAVNPGHLTNVGETNFANNNCGDTVIVNGPDLTAVKTNNVAGSTTLPNGWTWNILVSNIGTGAASFTAGQTVLTDNLPTPNLTFGAASLGASSGITGTIGCSIVSTTLTCTATTAVTIAPAGLFNVSFLATPSATGTYVNPPTGQVCAVNPGHLANVGETNFANNNCGDTVIVNGPDLTAVKTNNVGGSTTLPNGWTWNILVSNIGTGAASFTAGQTVLTDNLPTPNLTFGAASLGATSGITGTIGCAIVSTTLTCTATTAVTIAPAGLFNVSFLATPSATGTYVNPPAGQVCAVNPGHLANVGETNFANNSCGDTVIVNGPDLTAVKTNNVGGSTTLPNGWTWNILVSNIGTGAANFTAGQTVLTDNLPTPNLTFGAASLGASSGITGTIGCSIVSTTLTCTATTAVTIAPAGLFNVSFLTTPSATGTYVNPPTGQVCAVNPAHLANVGETNFANNNCGDTVIVNGPDLTAVKTNNVGGSTTLPNGWTWNILVSNIGTGAASFTAGQTVLTDNLPTPNLTFGAASLGASSGVTGTVGCTIVATTLTCTATTAVTIAPAGLFNVSFLATPSATGTYVNPPTGQVCAVNPAHLANVGETNFANNNCGDIVIVNGPDLTAVKTNNVSGSTTLPNGWTWNIKVSNIGTGAASFTAGQTVLTDNLPTPNLTFGAASLGASSGVTGTVGCTIVATTLTCTATTAVTIAPAGLFNVSFLATPSATGTYVNPPTGQVCAVNPAHLANVGETNFANNNCGDIVIVNGPDLTAVKTNNVSGSTTLPNGWTWNIKVSNIGTGAASFTAGQTVLTDNLPTPNLTFGAASLGAASGITGTVGCTIVSTTLTCTATTAVTIAPAGLFNVSFLATPSAAGTYVNPPTGQVCAVNPGHLANVGETNFANNNCGDIVIVNGPDLKAVKTDNVGGSTTLPNGWTWTIAVSNVGTGPATFTAGQTVLTDNLPTSSLTYGSTTLTPSGITGTIGCSISGTTLTCTASTAVTIPTTGSFNVSFLATPSAAGIYVNPPTGQVCAVNPGHLANVGETNFANNTCGDTVTVLPPCVGTGLNLGTDANYIFIDIGKTHLSWNAYQVDGNVLFGQGLTAQLSGGNNGGLGAGYTVSYDPTTSISGMLQNPLILVSVPTSQTAAAAAAAQSVSNFAKGLTPTQTFTTISNNTTINGNGGLNVIKVGSINNANLTIHGSANDFFVFNVTTGIQTNQVMTLTGGVTASHILWNLTGTGTVLQTSGGDMLVGTFLATNGGQFLFSELQLTGALINTGGNIQLVSGNHTLYQAGFTPPPCQ